MTPTTRRLYSIFAFSVFCVMAIAVVAWTNGYQWSSWNTGIVRTGALFVSSEPKATLYLNATAIGQTPQRLSRIAPGVYTLTIKKAGFGDWSSTIRIASGIGQVIGPVQLYPESFTSTTQKLPDNATLLHSDDQHHLFTLTAIGTSWDVRELWPTTLRQYTLEKKPTSVTMSPNGETTIFSDGTQANVYTKNAIKPWIIPTPMQLSWDDQSPTLFYGLQDGNINRYDALTSTITPIARGDSFVLIKDTVWYTTSNGPSTVVSKITTFGQQASSTVFERAGTWTLLPEHSGLLLKNSATNEVLLIRPESFSSLYTSTSLGQLDTWWWASNEQAPIWLSGSDVWTLDTQSDPQLIDRFPTQIQQAHWLITGHILLLVDSTSVRIVSVSTQQGRGTLLTWPALHPLTLVGFEPSKNTLVIHQADTTEIQVLTW